MLFKAAVVTWNFVQYFIASPATPVRLQCSSEFSARGAAAPTAPPLWLRHWIAGTPFPMRNYYEKLLRGFIPKVTNF